VTLLPVAFFMWQWALPAFALMGAVILFGQAVTLVVRYLLLARKYGFQEALAYLEREDS